jgi:hypothetical protein
MLILSHLTLQLCGFFRAIRSLVETLVETSPMLALAAHKPFVVDNSAET